MLIETKVLDTEQGQAFLIPEELRTKDTEFFMEGNDGVYTFCTINDNWIPSMKRDGWL